MHNIIKFDAKSRILSFLARRLLSYHSFISGDENEVRIILSKQFSLWRILRMALLGLEISVKGSRNYITITVSSVSTAKILVNGDDNSIRVKASYVYESEFIVSGADCCQIKIEDTSYSIRRSHFGISSSRGSIHIGRNTHMMPNLYVVVGDSFEKPVGVEIGENCDIGMDTIIRVSDGHALIDPATHQAVNEPKSISIGNHVWIGARCVILKGAVVPCNSMVGAMSIVTHVFTQKGIILIGSPAKILREGIEWNRLSYGQYKRKFERINS